MIQLQNKLNDFADCPRPSRTARCQAMASDIALVAEPQADAKEHLLKMLAGVGYLAFWAPTPTELDQELERSLVVTAASLLVVVDVLLAKSCSHTF